MLESPLAVNGPCGDVDVAGVNVEVFSLHAPTIPGSPFEAAADRVARAPVIVRGREARSGDAQFVAVGAPPPVPYTRKRSQA